MVTTTPHAGQHWDFFFDHGPVVSDDFMTDREQPMPQEHENPTRCEPGE